MEREVTPEYDMVVGKWAGFDEYKWDKIEPEIKERFYENYDKATLITDEDTEEED